MKVHIGSQEGNWALAACRTGQNRRSNLETNEIDERIFIQRNSSLLAISILLFHLSAKSDRLLVSISNKPPIQERALAADKPQPPFRHRNYCLPAGMAAASSSLSS